MWFIWYEVKLIRAWQTYKLYGFLAAFYSDFIIMWVFLHALFGILFIILYIIYDHQRVYENGIISVKTKVFIDEKKIFKSYKKFLDKYITPTHLYIFMSFYAGVFSFIVSIFLWFLLPYTIDDGFNLKIFNSLLNYVCAFLAIKGIMVARRFRKINKLTIGTVFYDFKKIKLYQFFFIWIYLLNFSSPFLTDFLTSVFSITMIMFHIWYFKKFTLEMFFFAIVDASLFLFFFPAIVGLLSPLI